MFLLILLGAIALGLAGLLVVVRRRSLSGFQNGFLLTLALVLAGTGALSAALIGGWLYRSAESALVQGTVDDLDADARLVETAALSVIELTIVQMTRLAEGIGPNLQRQAVKDVELAVSAFQYTRPCARSSSAAPCRRRR